MSDDTDLAPDTPVLAVPKGPLTLKQIARLFGVSTSAVQFVEQSALRRLRTNPLARRLAREMGINLGRK